MNSQADTNATVGSPLEELLPLLELMRPPQPKGKPIKSLLGAVYANDPGLVKTFLAAGSSANEANKYGVALSTAVSRGNLEILNLLIAAGAKKAGSQLASAAQRGDLAIMRRLFEVGVDLGRILRTIR